MIGASFHTKLIHAVWKIQWSECGLVENTPLTYVAMPCAVFATQPHPSCLLTTHVELYIRCSINISYKHY